MLISEGDAPPPPSMNSQSPGPLPETVLAHLIKAISLYILTLKAILIMVLVPSALILMYQPVAAFHLEALNYLIHSFESDVVIMDYKVRALPVIYQVKSIY